MNMIRELCPICGGFISHMVLTCIPPINKKTCQKCGKSWQKKQDIIEYRFNPEGWEEQP